VGTFGGARGTRGAGAAETRAVRAKARIADFMMNYKYIFVRSDRGRTGDDVSRASMLEAEN